MDMTKSSREVTSVNAELKANFVFQQDINVVDRPRKFQHIYSP
jgi:hypothetical protein